MLWLSLYFPTLTLDIAERGTTGTEPLAVLDTGGPRPRVLQCNQVAAEQGVHTGMSLHAALALIPDLHCRQKDASLEKQALQRLAGWAFRYSPMVSLGRGPEILLEIEGSLSLFRGLDGLCEQAAEALAQLGYNPRLAVAPFPEAAALLARGGEDSQVQNPKAIAAALGHLPIGVLEPDESVVDKLRSLGVLRISDLLALPRDGLRRRFDPALIDRLERALGERPDPRQAWRRPSRFRASLELPAPVHTTEPLLFVLRRLLKELAEVLTALGKGVDRLEILLRHDHRQATPLAFGLAQPGRDADHWLGLLRTRFEGVALEQPVQSVELRAGRFSDLKGVNLALFEDEVSRGGLRLMDRLRARLGETAVRGMDLVEDHRPEKAWRAISPRAAAAGYEDPAEVSADDAARRAPGESPGKGGCSPTGNASPAKVTSRRPLWLLLSPVPLAKEAHREWRLRGAERIEAGWWDGDDVARDYYMAETPRGEKLWVFRDLRDRGWYLHGVFS